MGDAFSDVRERIGRLPSAAAIALWLIAVFTSWFVGIFVAVLVAALVGLPFAMLGADIVATVLYVGTWLLVIVWAGVAPLFALRRVDRIAHWAARASAADPSRADDARIIDAASTIAIAAGAKPTVLVVDAPFMNAAGLGAAPSSSYAYSVDTTLVVTRSSASLSNVQLRALLATALTDAVEGRGAAEARILATTPALLPLFALHRWSDQLLRSRRRAVISFAALMLGWGVFSASVADGVPKAVIVRVLLAPLLGAFFAILFAGLIAIVVVICAVWLAVLSVPPLWFASRARAAADVAAIQLTRDPNAWARLLAEAPTRRKAPILDRLMIGWTLPRSQAEAQRRIRAAASAVPGVAHSLGSSAR
jgi:hypothetical protein